jgi:dTDP-4-dehydrorhamnose reductase
MIPPETILVIGADGMIGLALVQRLLGQGRPVVRTMRVPEAGAVALDLSVDVSAWAPPCEVEVAYLCAAVTSIEDCRKDPAGSFAVNVTGTVNLARTLLRQGALVVFPSTNLVFDGSTSLARAEMPVAPATQYGRQKAEAEKQLTALSDRVCIVRFSKVLGPRAPLFMRWADDLRKGRPIHPFSDMPVSPVPLGFAIDVLLHVGRKGLRGTVQVSGTQDVSYEAIARRLARRIGASETLVEPKKAALAVPGLEHVPAHTTLDVSRLQDELEMTPPDVWTTIDGAFA